MENNLKIPECCSEVVSFEANERDYVISCEMVPNADVSQGEIIIIMPPEGKDVPHSILTVQSMSPLQSPKSPNSEPDEHPRSQEITTTRDTIDLNIRKNFVRKVLAILMTQMLISVFLVGITYIPNLGIKNFLTTKKYVLLIAMLVILACFVTILCKKSIAQKVPQNYILLFTFTIALSYVLAFLASFTESFIVLISAALTLLIVLAAILSACRLRKNNSFIMTFLYQAIPVFVLLAVVGLSYPKFLVRTAISVAIVVVISVHLTISIHGLISNFEKIFKVDDYILAAMQIYTDVYLIFVKGLTILTCLFRPCSYQ